MKKVYKVNKSRLYGAADYSAILSGHEFAGYALERIDTEEIEIVSHAVCFFDPYDPGNAKSFTAAFPSGKYRPYMMTVSTSEGKRVALAGLDGGDLHTAAVWRLAFTDERDAIKLSVSDETVGVTIGSGFGALSDTATLADFVKLVKDGEDSFHPLDGAVNMDGSCAQICKLKNVSLPVFNTGWGEGCYPCYIGEDNDGRVLGVICDFGMVECVKKKQGTQIEEFVFDVDVYDAFVPDPKKSDSENSIALCSAVIESSESDYGDLLGAYARRGYAYHTSARYDEALSDYLAAIKLGKRKENAAEFPMHAWSLYDNAATICRDKGMTDEAIRLYKEAFGISDTFYGGAYAGLIDIYRESKNYAKALEVADEMVKARPQDPSSYLRRSEIFMASEEYEKAVADLDVLINRYKLNESILDKSICLAYLGRNKEALDVLDAYLLEGRANEVYYDIRAGIHLADNNFAAAYIDALKAFDVNPDYLNTLEKLIELDGLFFNFKSVVKWASRYIEALPRTEYGYSVRADALFQLGEYEDAVADYTHLWNSEKDCKYCGLLIKSAVKAGDKGLAKKHTKQLRKTDNAYYIYAVGLLLLSEKKYARAERYLASAFALKEDYLMLSSLIDCYIESGSYDKCAGAMNKFAQMADGEEVFVKHAAIAKKQGVSSSALCKEYVARFLGGCEDEVLTDKVKGFFNNLAV